MKKITNSALVNFKLIIENSHEVVGVRLSHSSLPFSIVRKFFGDRPAASVLPQLISEVYSDLFELFEHGGGTDFLFTGGRVRRQWALRSYLLPGVG